jgi:hypothetical protein
MPNEEAKKETKPAPITEEPGTDNEESASEETEKGNWREAFVAAFEKTRRQQKPTESRRELGRDKSKSLLLLAGVCVGLLLLFFGVFSHPKKKIPLPGETAHGQPNLGQRVTPGQENNDPTKMVTPMLSADVRSTDAARTAS